MLRTIISCLITFIISVAASFFVTTRSIEIKEKTYNETSRPPVKLHQIDDGKYTGEITIESMSNHYLKIYIIGPDGRKEYYTLDPYESKKIYDYNKLLDLGIKFTVGADNYGYEIHKEVKL